MAPSRACCRVHAWPLTAVASELAAGGCRLQCDHIQGAHHAHVQEDMGLSFLLPAGSRRGTTKARRQQWAAVAAQHGGRAGHASGSAPCPRSL